MCGIVGLISAFKNGLSHKEGEIFKHMLFVDTLRGWDSTGVFGGDWNANVDIHKGAITGAEFIRTKEYDDFETKMIRKGAFVVGHNRAATRGTIKDENAHPFWVDDKIVLVQNGTYRGSHKHHKDTEVDTEAIAHVISEEKDIGKALASVNAAFALVWYNTENKTLHLIRNVERPLYLAKLDSGAYVFASELETILWATTKAGVRVAESKLIDPHTLYTFNMEDNTLTHKEEKVASEYSFRHASWEADQDDVYGYNGWVPQHQRNLALVTHHPPPSARQLTGGNNDVIHGFHSVIVSKGAQYLFDDQAKADRAREKWKAMAPNGTRMVVELIDYIPANDLKTCTAWHVYGTALSPEENAEGGAVLVHWLAYGKSEEDILAMFTAGFYSVEKNTVGVMGFKSDTTKQWLVSMYASAPMPATTHDNVQ